MPSLFDLLRKIPAIRRKEEELKEVDKKVEWTIKRFEELDEQHKEVVRSNGFASAFIYDKGERCHAR